VKPSLVGLLNPFLFRIFLSLSFGLVTLAKTTAATPSDFCNDSDSIRVLSQTFFGLQTTRPEVVKRELKNSVGEIFSCKKWEEERQSLLDLDIFADVEIRQAPTDSTANQASQANQANLEYHFRELPPYIPFVAIAKTEQDGFSIGPALASLNFLGQGTRSEFISRFGGTTEFQASMSSTRLGDLPLQYDLAVIRIASFNHFENFEENSWRAKLDLVHRLGGFKNLLYAGEIFHLESTDSVSRTILLNSEGDFVPRLGGGLLWDSRDRRHDPRHGLYQELRLTQDGGWLGGPADFTEWLSDTRLYLPWLNTNVLQLASLYQYRTGTLGETFGQYDEYHVGGLNTLRGFSHDAYRGKSEVILTSENRTDLIRKKVLKLWKWSAYYGLQGIVGLETASLWNHNALLENDFHTSGYLGLHLLIAGVDRIRLEAGSNFAKFQVEADLGILDKVDIQRFRSR